MEHHQEATATRIANLINKGVIWEKVWSHPLILSACRYIFNGDFKVSSLNAREALYNGGHQPLHADWKKPRPDFPKVHLVNTIWAIDDLSAANGAPRIIPGTHLRPELPEEVLADPEQAHPDEIVFAAPAGSVMIYNAHARTAAPVIVKAADDAYCMGYISIVRIRRSRTSGAGSRRRRQAA